MLLWATAETESLSNLGDNFIGELLVDLAALLILNFLDAQMFTSSIWIEYLTLNLGILYLCWLIYIPI